MKLLEGYRSFLSSLGITAKDDLLYYVDEKTPVEFTYNKVKRHLALPTSAMIKKGMVDKTGAEVHAFHPLCEDVLRGESGTVRYLKREIRANFIKQSMVLIAEIIRIKSEKISPRSSTFTRWLAESLGDLKDVQWDDKLKKSYEKAVLEMMVNVNDTCNIYITNKTKIGEDVYLRAANITTIMDQLGEEGADFFSAKLNRKVDKVVLVRLMNAVLGWIPSEVGSNDNCPYFGCLARAWHEYVRNYNNVVRAIKDHTSLKPLPQDWFVVVQEMDRYRNLIQTLPYNTGPRDSVTTANSITTTTALGANVQEAVPVAAAFASETTTASGTVDIYSALGVEKGLAANGFGGVDLTIYTPAQQDIIRKGGRYDSSSILDRRLIKEPEREISIVERNGLQNRDIMSSMNSNSIIDNLGMGNSGSIFDSNYGSNSMANDFFGNNDLFGNSGIPDSRGVNNNFFTK